MIQPEIPINEEERLVALSSYSIMDTIAEDDFDSLTLIAAQICDTPVSLISLIDNKRQWFKSKKGISMEEMPKEYSFCGHAINRPTEIMLVEDARLDARFCDNPLVVSYPYAVFYAGVPLLTEDGYALGTLCVMDNKPRALTDTQLSVLRALATQIVQLMKSRRNAIVLEQTIETLGRRNKELESFSYMVAHDIKAPLNNIDALLQIIASDNKTSFTEETVEMLGLIQKSSNNLRGLVKELLEYSINPQELNLPLSGINLKEFMKELEDSFQYEQQKRFSLVSDIDVLVSNKIALEQIFSNLISNSIKYNDKERVDIGVKVDDIGSFYEITYQDNGLGIATSELERVFEPFSVFESTDKYGDKGNGLGLAIVKKQVEGLGGQIKVKSNLGEGTQFRFTLSK